MAKFAVELVVGFVDWSFWHCVMRRVCKQWDSAVACAVVDPQYLFECVRSATSSSACRWGQQPRKVLRARISGGLEGLPSLPSVENVVLGDLGRECWDWNALARSFPAATSLTIERSSVCLDMWKLGSWHPLLHQQQVPRAVGDNNLWLWPHGKPVRVSFVQCDVEVTELDRRHKSVVLYQCTVTFDRRPHFRYDMALWQQIVSTESVTVPRRAGSRGPR